MIYKNTDQLSGWLKRDKHPQWNDDEFDIDVNEYARHLRDLILRPVNEREDAAVYRCLSWDLKPIPSIQPLPPGTAPDSLTPQIAATLLDIRETCADILEAVQEKPEPAGCLFQQPTLQEKEHTNVGIIPAAPTVHVTPLLTNKQEKILTDIKHGLFLAVTILLLILLFGSGAFAQNVNPAIVVATCGTVSANFPGAGNPAPNTVDANGNLCIGGTIATTVLTSGLAISVTVGATSSGVAVNPSGGVASTSAPTYANGTIVPFSFETDGDLRVAATVSLTTSGLATSALQTTGNTSLGTIAGAVAGTEMQVDVLTLPSVTVGTFPDNEPINTAQYGGTAVVAANTPGIHVVAGAVATTAAPTRTNNTYGMLSMDLNAALRTAVQSVAGTIDVNVTSAPGITVVSTPITSGVSVAAGSSTSGININPAGGAVHTSAPVYTNGTFNSLSLTTAGAVRTDASATTQPVSGTVTVTDGAGSLNTIVDSGTITTVSSVTAIANALPAGTNNIGDVDILTIAAGNNNIGDVDVASIAAGDNNIGNVDVVTLPNVTIGTFPDNEPFNWAQTAGATMLQGAGTSTLAPRFVVANPDPCVSGYTKSPVVVSVTTSTQIVTLSSTNYIYVCSINVGPIGTATNVALVAGTGTLCATSIGGVMPGGVSAATGWTFAANGGLTMGNGQGYIARTDATGENLCLLLSASNQVSAVLTVVYAP